MNKARLSELVEFNPRRPLKKGSLAPFIEMAALPESSRDIANIYDREYRGGGAKFTNGDTLFARITPCLENGKTAKVAGLKGDAVGHGSTEFIVMSPRNPEVDEDYIYYLARLPDFRIYAQARMEGTSGRQRVSWQSLADFELQIPDATTRKRAGKVLKAFDDKIQLNHQINQTLEQMAQAIFKSWFVDFEPVKAKMAAKESWQALQAEGEAESLPDLETWMNLAAMQVISGQTEAALNQMADQQPEQFSELFKTAALFPAAMQDSELGEIPEGWIVDHLSKIIRFNPNRSLKKGTLAPYLDMKNVPTSGHLADDVVLREMNSGTKFVNGDTLLARITPCLENGKTAYVDFLVSDQVGWGSTEYIVMRSEKLYPESISYFIARDSKFRQHAIQSMTGTSGRQRANAKALAELPWIIYPKALIEAFDRIATPYLKLAKSHGSETKSLTALRDTLLPKLLSGELSVADFELEGEA
ncbi:MAG: restriction endonuclease subunit S [Marinospirillum sp.]|nr:restriction endonuclease subunit S [Marinospirillum sp.]